MAESDGCSGYIWGEVGKPTVPDFDGYGLLGSDKWNLIASQHAGTKESPRAANTWGTVQKICVKAEDWGTSLRITKNTIPIHR